MSYRTTIAGIGVTLLLAACASGPQYGRDYGPDPGARPAVTPTPGPVQAHPLARSVSYTCEDLTTVVLTEGVPDARATLNSGLELSLARTGGFGGGRYGLPPYEFRSGAAGEGVWINQGRVNRCRVK